MKDSPVIESAIVADFCPLLLIITSPLRNVSFGCICVISS